MKKNNNVKIITDETKNPLIFRKQFVITMIIINLIVLLYTILYSEQLLFVLFAQILIIILVAIAYLRYKNSIPFKLKKFIIDNNLYNDSISARLGYKQDKDYITIRYFKDANVFTEKSDTFAKSFTALLDKSIKEISPTNTYVDYIYEKNRDLRLTYKELNNYDNKIQVTKNIGWQIGTPPHILIAGNTNSGKTYMLLMLIISYLKLKADIKIIDPKNADLAIVGNRIDITKYNQVKNVATQQEEILRIFKETNEEMEKRYKEWFSNNVNSLGKTWRDIPGAKPIVLIIDEFNSFEIVADKNILKEIQGYLSALILKGRMAGIEIIMSVNRADINTTFTGLLRSQFGVKILLGIQTEVAFKMMFPGNNFNSGVHRTGGSGTGYIYIDGLSSCPRYFEVPLLPNNKDYFDTLDEAILINLTK